MFVDGVAAKELAVTWTTMLSTAICFDAEKMRAGFGFISIMFLELRFPECEKRVIEDSAALNVHRVVTLELVSVRPTLNSPS